MNVKNTSKSINDIIEDNKDKIRDFAKKYDKKEEMTDDDKTHQVVENPAKIKKPKAGKS